MDYNMAVIDNIAFKKNVYSSVDSNINNSLHVMYDTRAGPSYKW